MDPVVSLGLMHTHPSSVSCDKLIVLQRRKYRVSKFLGLLADISGNSCLTSVMCLACFAEG